MASKSSRKSRKKHPKLTAGGVWKGENETDPELMDNTDKHPLSDADVWTEDEAYQIYRGKLIRLRDLYVGQLGHLSHVLQEKRREFLQQYQQEGGALAQASQPSKGGSLEDAAYRCYRKRSGEEALLERKQKHSRISASLEYFCKRDTRDLHKSHYQNLVKMHQQQTTTSDSAPCTTNGCENHCLPYASRCLRHICDDEKQLLYTKCSYSYPSGAHCTNPVPLYMVPPLCGGHCDNISLNPPEIGEPSIPTSQSIPQDVDTSLDSITSETIPTIEKPDVDVQR